MSNVPYPNKQFTDINIFYDGDLQFTYQLGMVARKIKIMIDAADQQLKELVN